MRRYNPKDLEPKIRKFWDEKQVYKADLNSKKPKYIAMSMFNYPSGAGIHIGHAMNYTISDVLARFKRQQGYESYHPVGWDAFGLPAENYAIKAGVSPQQSMSTIIPSYHEQYKAMGWSNDWSKEISTHLPVYYKWTQWIFSEMYRAGLAYQDARTQWWCDKCQTVLANEQVIDDKCWRHDNPDDPEVQKKEVKQWFFKITEYADELLEAIDDLDWTESVKLAQKNWIGKSKGAEIDFAIIDPEMSDAIGSDERKEASSNATSGTEAYREVSSAGDDTVIAESDGGVSGSARKQNGTTNCVRVFTTRPDTLYGVTFMVLAPEHPLVKEYAEKSENTDEIKNYVSEALRKTEVDREKQKEKTGVELKGLKVVNPINNEEIPVWVADYVLASYGTGAIMAVPAHDERDQEFATKYNIEVRQVITPTKLDDFVAFDVDGEGRRTTGDIVVSEKIDGQYEEIGNSSVTLPYKGEGEMMNSGEYNGMRSAEAREKIIGDLEKKGLAKAKTQYKINDWSVSRQRYWGAPIPIVHCGKCGPVLVNDKDLPVELPELDDFQPSGDGRSALARAKDWLEIDCPKCGGKAERETDTLDTYICSSWYMMRYFDPTNTEKIFDSKIVNKWMPIDFYNGGDHATAHMIYARFITRFFHKKGLMDNPEPFKKFLFNGKVRASDGTIFSKSKGTGVDPREIIDQGYGADALRTYLMFAAPLEFNSNWDPRGVPATHRFLNRLWILVQEYIDSAKQYEERGNSLDSEGKKPADQSDRLNKVIHKAIFKATKDIEELKYNTAISAMMSAVNDLYKIKVEDGYQSGAWQFALESMAMIVAPFAPHIAEKLWHELGREDSVQVDHWPQWDDQYLVDDMITIVVQVNGKVRANIEVSADASEDEVKEKALTDEKIIKFTDNKKPTKVIYVPGRLVNVVI